MSFRTVKRTTSQSVTSQAIRPRAAANKSTPHGKKLLLWNSKAIERGTVRITYKEPDRAEEKSESDNNNKNEGAGFSAWARSTEITKPKTPRPSSFIYIRSIDEEMRYRE